MVKQNPNIAWVPDRAKGLEITQLVATARINGRPVTLTAYRVIPANAVTREGPYRPYDQAEPVPWQAIQIDEYPGAWLVSMNPDPDPQEEMAIAARSIHPREMAIPDSMPDPTLLDRDDAWMLYVPSMPEGTSKMPGADRAWRHGWLSGFEGRGLSACKYVGDRPGKKSYRAVWMAGHRAGCLAKDRGAG